MDQDDLKAVVESFVRATELADRARFDALVLNMAEGYLLSSFLSPLSNRRRDDYGRSLANRMRFPLEVFDAVRKAWPQERPVIVALTAADLVEGGLEVGDTMSVARELADRGCDLILPLAGYTTAMFSPSYGPAFLAPYSDSLRNNARLACIAAGGITRSAQVNTLLAAGRADLCVLDIND
jgi:anthraniloyl-CoA monooxygenase